MNLLRRTAPRAVHLILASTLLGTACTHDSPAADDLGETAGDATASDSGSADTAAEAPSDSLDDRLEALAACDPTDLLITLPWMGPAFDPDTGALAEPLPAGHVEAVVNGWPRYDDDALSLRQQHGQATVMELFTRDGWLGMQSFESVQCDLSVSHSLWRDEESMFAFVAGSAHGAAMVESGSMHHAVAGAHWTNSSRSVPPDWREGLDHYLDELQTP